MAQHWSRIHEQGSVLGIKILLTCYAWFGRYVFKAVLWPVIVFYYWRAKLARTASLQYLARMQKQYPQSLQGQKLNHWLGIAHFYQFGLSIIDKIDAWVGKIDYRQVDYQGREYAERLFEQGKGAVFLTSHLGNMELCRAISNRVQQTRINVLVFTQNAVKFNQVLKEMNEQVDVDLIQVSDLGADSAIMLKERIDNGEFIVIVGDRTSITEPGKSIHAQFLGEPAPFPMGPFILAALMECPVYLIFCSKRASRFQITMEPFSEQPIKLPRKTRQQALQSWVQKYAERLEYHASQAPLQWFNFFDFWAKVDKASPASEGSNS